MASENVSASSASSSVPPSAPAEHKWDYITDPLTMTDEITSHFVAATGDDQKAHLCDEAARSLPFGLKSRIMHGALVRDIAVNFLVLRSVARMFNCSNTHIAIDKGGSYRPCSPVYPGDEIYVRFKVDGRFRVRASSIIAIQYAVFTDRDHAEPVMTGNQDAILAYLKPKPEASNT